MTSRKIDKALDSVSTFIKGLEIKEGPPSGYFFMRDQELLSLDGEDLGNYHKTMQLLIDCVDLDKTSIKEVEKYFQRAILYPLDIKGIRSEMPFKKRLQEALKMLRSELLKKPETVTIYYPVLGLSNENFPQKIGKVEFCVFSEKHKNQFIEGLDSIDENVREEWINYVNEGNINNQVVAKISVEAVDTEAAKYSGLKEIKFTINIINLFVDFIPYNANALIYLPSEKDSLAINIPIIQHKEKEHYIFSLKRVGPVGIVSFGKLFETFEEQKINFNYIESLLRCEKRNQFEDNLLSSISWAGKARCFQEDNKELAFLFFAIALETLLIMENDRDQITSKLKERTAKILANENEESQEIIKKEVSNLYDRRSEIVHDGKFEISEIDLGKIRLIFKNCIYRILTDDTTQTITNVDEFNNWINR